MLSFLTLLRTSFDARTWTRCECPRGSTPKIWIWLRLKLATIFWENRELKYKRSWLLLFGTPEGCFYSINGISLIWFGPGMIWCRFGKWVGGALGSLFYKFTPVLCNQKILPFCHAAHHAQPKLPFVPNPNPTLPESPWWWNGDTAAIVMLKVFVLLL